MGMLDEVVECVYLAFAGTTMEAEAEKPWPIKPYVDEIADFDL